MGHPAPKQTCTPSLLLLGPVAALLAVGQADYQDMSRDCQVLDQLFCKIRTESRNPSQKGGQCSQNSLNLGA